MTDQSEAALFLGHSGDWWDAALMIAGCVAAVGAVAVGGATVGTIIAHKRESSIAQAALEKFQLDTAGRVAEATKRGLEAGEKAATAQASADSARAETAKFQKEAAEANLRTEQLRASLAWRELDQAQLFALHQIAIRNVRSLNIRYTDGDPEAQAFSMQLADVFIRAGWRVGQGSMKLFNSIAFGLIVQTDEAQRGSELLAMLQASNIQAVLSPLPNNIGFGVDTVPNAALLLVGSKPRDRLPLR